ncbi:hypothetical protein LTS18_006962 [Coniosporium uncinatum]|uniref:Uncharacterized protein n=1 Tax=Coniosporium uncinatum TaxID=93489 RepID=A0ACC3DAY3_9PEZI|nr:hypothetical protein LTS18_006962 [Coniosporium uncinatum]
MDRIVSIILGRPLAIREDDFDVRLPAVDDEAVFYGELSNREDSASGLKTSIFVHITNYRLICGRVMLALHQKGAEGRSQREIATAKASLQQSLEDWKHATNELQLSDFDLMSAEAQDNSSFKSKAWFELLFHNAMLMLNRPSPLLSDISRDPETLRHIYSSSRQAITLYAHLHRSRRINYSWVTLQSVFMAGLSYIYAVSRHFRERRRGSHILGWDSQSTGPATIEIVNDTRACSKVLVAVSERWNAGRHCHEVFDKLSDAVLMDAIKIQTPIQASEQSSRIERRDTPDSIMSDNPSAPSITSMNSQGAYIPHQPYTVNGTSWPAPGVSNTASPLAVDNQFLHCFADLQHPYQYQQWDDPVAQLSQDWLSYLACNDEGSAV